MYGIENGRGRRDPATVFERVRVCRVRSRDRVRLPSRGRARRPSRVGRRVSRELLLYFLQGGTSGRDPLFCGSPDAHTVHASLKWPQIPF